MVKIEVTAKTRKYISDRHQEYMRQTSVPKLETKISCDLNKKGERKSNRKRRRFLITLFGGTKKRREERLIDICLSDNLWEIIEKFECAFRHIYGFEFSSNLDIHKIIIRNTKEDLDSILNYVKFNFGKKHKSGEKWDRHRFITALDIKVCPYCNRQYITSYEHYGKRTTADADHYYIKSKYPILQMNVFNLVPSCNVCNSKTKGKSTKEHLYPYKDASDSLIFKIPLRAGGRVSKILIDTQDNTRAEGSVNTFKLDKIYQAHLEEASEIKDYVEEYFAYGESAYESIYGLTGVPFTIFNKWFRFMSKDMSEEPLIKLKQDIFVQVKAEYEK